MQINQVLHFTKIHRIVETNHVYYYKMEKFEIFRDEGGEIKARINNDRTRVKNDIPFVC